MTALWRHTSWGASLYERHTLSSTRHLFDQAGPTGPQLEAGTPVLELGDLLDILPPALESVEVQQDKK